LILLALVFFITKSHLMFAIMSIYFLRYADNHIILLFTQAIFFATIPSFQFSADYGK